MYPHGEYTKNDIEKILRFSLEMRRRVKEQLKKIGGMEFYDVNFSYIDNETFEEKYVPVQEQSSGTLIPDGIGKQGHLYSVSRGESGMIGVFKLVTQMTSGNGKFERTGIGSKCLVALKQPVLASMAVLGNVSIGGTLIKVEELANTLQVCQDSGAKKVLLPLTSAADPGTVPLN